MTSELLAALADYPPERIAAGMEAVSAREVRRALENPQPRPGHLLALLSPQAAPFLEEMAQMARQVTLRRFGRTMTLYAPLYLSNHCINHCTYCGFNAARDIPRRALSLAEALGQAEHLLSQGIRHLLLVTGEAPARYGLAEICEVVEALRPRVASLSVEIFPCDEGGYERLGQAGVDGLVLYQETYDRVRYRAFHPQGPKQDFTRRLEAMDAGARAGFRSLGVGALLGLTPHRIETFYLALHAAHLRKHHFQARLGVSFPRLRPVSSGTPTLHPVSNAELVQAIVAFRLLFPDAELVISTRESAPMRDRLMHLGVTRMSAGSRTSPGGYGSAEEAPRSGQFDIDDQREIGQIAEAIREAGLDVITKDFDPAFLADPGTGP